MAGAWRRVAADKAIREMNEAILILGTPVLPSGRTRVLIRRHYASAPGIWGATVSLFIFLSIPLLALRLNIELVDAALRLADDPPFGLDSDEFTLAELWDTVSDSNPVMFAGGIALALIALVGAGIFLTGIGLFLSVILRWQTDRLKGESGSSHYLAAGAASAVHQAAAAYRSAPGSPKQQSQLRHLTELLDRIYVSILRISDVHEAVHRRSRRRGKLRDHHLKVIAALQEHEAAIDIDARTALPDLAETLTNIANAYSEGKIGQLLPGSEIDHLSPAEVAKGQRFKVVVLAVVLGGCGISVAFLDLPDTATTSLIGAIGITFVSLVYGRRAREGLDLLDSLRGIQRS
ncbi:hypothetical protein [Streptomyces ardesiacus]|uniref:hypothetical protein n=1 Tax=Streptomyces ardesiacus TaxID=285564 RepID=UPI003654755E